MITRAFRIGAMVTVFEDGFQACMFTAAFLSFNLYIVNPRLLIALWRLTQLHTGMFPVESHGFENYKRMGETCTSELSLVYKSFWMQPEATVSMQASIANPELDSSAK